MIYFNILFDFYNVKQDNIIPEVCNPLSIVFFILKRWIPALHALAKRDVGITSNGIDSEYSFSQGNVVELTPELMEG